jgi:hypothetical protein
VGISATRVVSRYSPSHGSPSFGTRVLLRVLFVLLLRLERPLLLDLAELARDDM